jgi:hypothetical protein
MYDFDIEEDFNEISETQEEVVMSDEDLNSLMNDLEQYE